MKFEENILEAKFKINSYTNSSVTINKQKYNKSLIIYQDDIFIDWELQDINKLSLPDLNLLNKYNPELIILSTGDVSTYPTKNSLTLLYNSKIPFEIMNTASACRTYNLLVNDNRNIAVGIIINDNN